MLRTDPRFTLGVATVLALSVAATIMIASVVNAIVLRPLPCLDSDGIIQVTKAARGRLDDGHSYSSFEAFRTRSRVFTNVAAFEWQTSGLYLDEIGEHVPGGSGFLQLFRGAPRAVGVAGVAIGLSASLAAKKLLSSFLFGVSTTDPVTLFGIALLIPCVAAAASFIPAVRATHIDPSVVLRCE